jgi:hypothetical protein
VPILQRALFVPLTQLLGTAPVSPALIRPPQETRSVARATLRWQALLAAVIAVMVGAPTVRAQAAYARFDITSVNDSTFSFASTGARWVKRGQKGLVVDPMHGDELIAKFRVTRTGRGTATALITGQTARLTTSHIALLTQPHPLFLTRAWFWLGVALGGAVGWVAHH